MPHLLSLIDSHLRTDRRALFEEITRVADPDPVFRRSLDPDAIFPRSRIRPMRGNSGKNSPDPYPSIVFKNGLR